MKKRRSLFALCFTLGLAFCLFLIGPSLNNMKNVFAHQEGQWIGSWATSPQPPYSSGISKSGFHNKTVRLIAHPHMNGESLRLRLSNRYGEKALRFNDVSVGISEGQASISPGTNQPVTFNGKSSITIPIGEEVISDPVALRVIQGQDLAVSVYVPNDSGPATWHLWSQQTSYIADGNHVTDNDSSAFSTEVNSWFWLTGIDVIAESGVKGAIVTFGDSITDSGHSTVNANRRWPDFLAARIKEETLSPKMSVLNAGISGNRILAASPSGGISALERFEYDALGQTGVTDVILLEGINDILNGTSVEADEIITGLEQLIQQTYARDLNIYGGTIMPFKGYSGFTETREEVRQAVNHWIRTSGAFDGVIDFDEALRDPQDPLRLLAAYDPGDHLHPNDAGTKAMADAVDLSLFSQEDLAPKTWVDLSMSGFIQAGKKVKVKAKLFNLANEPLTDVKLSLAVPEDWQVQADPSAHRKVLKQGEQIETVFYVTPTNVLEQDAYDVMARADFQNQLGRYEKTNLRTVQVLANPITKTSWVSDLDWISATNGWGPVERDMSNGEQAKGDGNPLSINGMKFEKGLGVHAPSEILYYLGGQVDRFQSKVGVDDQMSASSPASIHFEVWGDDEKLYDSGLMKAKEDAKIIDLNVKDIEVLKLIVTDGGNGNGSDHGNWADAKFIVNSDVRIEDISNLVQSVEDEFFSVDLMRTLQTHLRATTHYEQQAASAKVLKHMKGFRALVEAGFTKQLISENAYQKLISLVDDFIENRQ